MKKDKKQSRDDELWAVTLSLVDFAQHLFQEHKVTIPEFFVVMNSCYTNFLDQMLHSYSGECSVDDVKSFLKSKVQQVIETLENDLPIEEINDEQTK